MHRLCARFFASSSSSGKSVTWKAHQPVPVQVAALMPLVRVPTPVTPRTTAPSVTSSSPSSFAPAASTSISSLASPPSGVIVAAAIGPVRKVFEFEQKVAAPRPWIMVKTYPRALLRVLIVLSSALLGAQAVHILFQPNTVRCFDITKALKRTKERRDQRKTESEGGHVLLMHPLLFVVTVRSLALATDHSQHGGTSVLGKTARTTSTRQNFQRPTAGLCACTCSIMRGRN